MTRPAEGVHVEERESGDLPLLVVDTDRLQLVFAPTRGGRLLSLRADGTELLWQNPELLNPELTPRLPVSAWPQGNGAMATWANVGGSKTWPAPQGWSGEGEWAGPPDPVLDSGAWSVASQAGDGIDVVLTSDDDPWTGLRITRSFHVPATGTEFVQTTRFQNVSNRTIRWSIWEVCQVDASPIAGSDRGTVVVPMDESSRILELGDWFGALSHKRTDRTACFVVGTSVSKRGFADVEGSVTYQGTRGESLTLALDRVEGAEYPDGGAQVEVWFQTATPAPIAELGCLHPSADLVELEVLGPLVTLLPGCSTEASVGWSATGVQVRA